MNYHFKYLFMAWSIPENFLAILVNVHGIEVKVGTKPT